jgi:hypothetical protein
MSLPAPPGQAAPEERQRGPRRWWVRRLVPLVLLGVVGGIGHAAAAGVAVHRAALEIRHAAAAADDTGGRSGGQASQARSREVTAVLDRMNAALAKRDLVGYLAAMGPDQGLRTRQTASFRALGRLPFVQVRYGWNGTQWSRPPGLAQRYGDEEAVVAVVQRRYWLKGWDAAPTSELVALTFARRDGRWTVVGDSDGAGALPQGSVPEPWALGDVAVVTTPHVLLVGDRVASRQAELKRLASRVEEAVGGVRSVWTSKTWNGKVVVYAVTDQRFVSPWFGEQAADGRRSEAGDAAEFDAEVVPMEAASMDGSAVPHALAGMRMVIAPTVLGYSTSQARAVIRHELTHLATLKLGEEAPAWLTEGIAEYTAYRVTETSGGSSGKPDGVGALDRRGLPKPMWNALRRPAYRPELEAEHDAFYAGSGGEVSRRYTDGWLAALYIADTYGEARLREFVAQASDASVKSVAERERAALADVLDTDKAAFVADVGTYARNLRKHFV